MYSTKCFSILQNLVDSFSVILDVQWWFVNPGSDNPEISIIRTKSAGTDFCTWIDGRFSNPENLFIRKYRPGTNVSGLTNHHCRRYLFISDSNSPFLILFKKSTKTHGSSIVLYYELFSAYIMKILTNEWFSATIHFMKYDEQTSKMHMYDCLQYMVLIYDVYAYLIYWCICLHFTRIPFHNSGYIFVFEPFYHLSLIALIPCSIQCISMHILCT